MSFMRKTEDYSDCSARLPLTLSGNRERESSCSFLARRRGISFSSLPFGLVQGQYGLGSCQEQAVALPAREELDLGIGLPPLGLEAQGEFAVGPNDVRICRLVRGKG